MQVYVLCGSQQQLKQRKWNHIISTIKNALNDLTVAQILVKHTQNNAD